MSLIQPVVYLLEDGCKQMMSALGHQVASMNFHREQLKAYMT